MKKVVAWFILIMAIILALMVLTVCIILDPVLMLFIGALLVFLFLAISIVWLVFWAAEEIRK